MKYTIKVYAKNIDDAKAVERALKDVTTRAVALILGHLSGMNKDQQKRVLAYVADRLGIKF